MLLSPAGAGAQPPHLQKGVKWNSTQLNSSIRKAVHEQRVVIYGHIVKCGNA